MSATVTVTGVTGPGDALSAVVYTDVLSFKVDTNKNLLDLEFAQNKHSFITIVAAATVTATKSGTTWTLTIS
jgi:hypothetical protein